MLLCLMVLSKQMFFMLVIQEKLIMKIPSLCNLWKSTTRALWWECVGCVVPTGCCWKNDHRCVAQQETKKKKTGEYSVRIFGIAAPHSERHFSSAPCNAEVPKPERGHSLQSLLDLIGECI
jgi:hypothetical protein